MTAQRTNERDRAAPRMMLSLPGEFIGVQRTQNCILTNLSRSGVMIALAEPMPVGSDGYLRCGPIDHFMVVVRAGSGENALEFLDPITDKFVFDVRKLQEHFAQEEQRELRELARIWTKGVNTGHH